MMCVEAGQTIDCKEEDESPERADVVMVEKSTPTFRGIIKAGVAWSCVGRGCVNWDPASCGLTYRKQNTKTNLEIFQFVQTVHITEISASEPFP